MNRRNVILVATVIVLTAALLAWALMPVAIMVELAPVTRGAFEQTVDEQAKTRIRDHYIVSSPLAGELDRIALREGDDVVAGGVIARLHPVMPALLDARTEQELRRRVEAAQAAKERAEARVKQAEVGMEQSRLELERSRKLAESKMVAQAKLESDELGFQMSERELDSARADAHVAQHDIDIATAAVMRARDASGKGLQPDWPLRAPIAGRVLRVQQKSGGTVAVGTPLIELGEPENLEILIELLTTEAPQVVAGAAVRLDNWGGAPPLSGRVRRIEPWGFTKISALGVEEQRVNVLVDIVSDRSQWSALGEGYRLDAHIRVYARDDALRVPTGALFRSGAQWSVFAVTDGRARQTGVTVGRRTASSTEVLDGLKEGERVVLYPSDAVRDGVRLASAPSAR
jgi:HlyD family secretion protein